MEAVFAVVWVIGSFAIIALVNHRDQRRQDRKRQDVKRQKLKARKTKNVKRAYLVLGPERSGTRMMTGILMAAGCYGDDGHEQRLDNGILPGDGEPVVVWRRSVPHWTEWPDIPAMVEMLRGWGYGEVQAVVTTRDWYAMAMSQAAAGLTPDQDTAYQHLRVAYWHIFNGLATAGVPFVVASYESLVQRPDAVIANLMGLLGLPTPAWVIYDGNDKYYS